LPCIGTTQAAAASAAPSLKGEHGGGYYRFSVGGIEAVVISDGGIEFQPVQPTWAPEAGKEEVEATLRSAFLPTDRLNLEVNVLLLKAGGETILVDTGAGKLFGPALGKLRGRMGAAGVNPEQVTGIVLSHAHGDHYGGLLDDAGKPVYPNATYFASKAEIDYWTGQNPDVSKLRLPKEQIDQFLANARKHLGAIKEKLTPVEPGKKIVEGVEVVEAYGHTPGHIALLITSGNEALLNAADTAHHYVLMFAHPEWTATFDSDPQQAAKTRRRILDRAAADRIRVLGYHLPYPGLGHVKATKKGAFKWVPEPWSWPKGGS
ncbi:MAG: MBL fold metallo-hydrolase, partial [Thermodesulfobacteriota bacterium]